MKRLEAEARAAATPNGSVARKPKPSGNAPGRSVVAVPGPIVDTPAEKAADQLHRIRLVDHEDVKKGVGIAVATPQASVDDGCQIILACDVTAERNDKQQAEPMAQATCGQLDQAGIALGADEAGERPFDPAALDMGYFSGPAVECWSVRVSIRTSRRSGNGTTVRPTPAAAERLRRPRRRREDAGELKTAEGRAVDSRRKVIVEPVSGQIKEARGLRWFLLRGYGQDPW